MADEGEDGCSVFESSFQNYNAERKERVYKTG
jgi:hypothetical protein